MLLTQKNGGEFLPVGLALVIGDDVIDDLFQALRGVEEFFGVDVFDLNV
jgi:hypothetical protein